MTDQARKSDDLFLCPRRIEGGMSAKDENDCWNQHDGHRVCSYCGSAHPEDVLAGIEDGSIVLTPTDDSYKTYISGGKINHCTTGFYFQHLSQEQMDRFIELHNNKKMKIDYPGRFYVKPYFCQYKDHIQGA